MGITEISYLLLAAVAIYAIRRVIKANRKPPNIPPPGTMPPEDRHR